MKFIPTLLSVILIFSSGCVGAKKYRFEKRTRLAAEEREKVLVEELLYRKKENSGLVQSVGELNKIVGRQELEIKNLQTELTFRTQSMGESASKLSSEKATLEKNLISAREELGEKNEYISKVNSVLTRRKSSLLDIETGLNQLYAGKRALGVRAAVQGEMVLLTLPDNVLFESNGLSVSTPGYEVLNMLAQYLTARPSLSVDVVAYTDNVIPPKEKTIKDTWDWSLQRATNVVRALIGEFNVNANQLTPVGRGEFYPLTSNESAEGRMKNRRTVVVFRPRLPDLPQQD
ncbi:MAG: OmpA family protein [Lewinellaceae bacterium]|nr:OmpA family protein [Saprospiraceae bacterium]MCB9342206.1 OmpA family protein [Lewinellaceae bacterium]